MQDETRDRLIELLDELEAICHVPIKVDSDGCGSYDIEGSEYIADHILADGWIRPPCKVGDTVYWISPKNKIHKLEITSIRITVSETEYGCWGGDYTPVCFYQNDFGKTVFLTKSQAEVALKNEQEKL